MPTSNQSQQRSTQPVFIAPGTPAPFSFQNHVISGLQVTAVPTGGGSNPTSITCGGGVAVVSGKVIEVYTETYALVPNTGANYRLDLVQVGVGTIKKLTVKPGTAAASPTAPLPDADSIPIALVNIPSGGASLRYWDVQNDVRPSLVGPKNWP